MASRSLNKVQLIGNLTRDPELRYTPSGAAVCTIGLATNRYWTTESGEKKEETEFHRIVSWNKLAELCSQLLAKGRKIYVEGRLRTNAWQQADGTQRSSTEVVIEDMILLDSRRPVSAGGEDNAAGEGSGSGQAPVVTQQKQADDTSPKKTKKSDEDAKEEEGASPDTPKEAPSEDVNPDDIPF
ncbi:single-stranded DNA-binding protein [Patescibacteria group bacterium]|nr:single-stranded DNA-binding protein [Patescibacteria group bacterium]MBU1472482.1 single-stranded DNA-binding protein [Patescibacteria group bacterium]MBU2460296.1 single-stranded DNA-binding protein [Patescibacteria group bacterium]MBU2543846.1 single-stranded DNA-binding protein [Patescibacteria group bacterium]